MSHPPIVTMKMLNDCGEIVLIRFQVFDKLFAVFNLLSLIKIAFYFFCEIVRKMQF